MDFRRFWAILKIFQEFGGGGGIFLGIRRVLGDFF